MRSVFPPDKTAKVPKVSPSTPLYLVVSLDVEEEGLFGGSYTRHGASVRNVRYLERLIPLLREKNIPVTLFCAHSVFTDADACAVLARMRDEQGAEIGAHLHHWNTPPVLENDSVATGLVPVNAMRAKLKTLFEAGQLFQGAPLTSFRMGRWDLHRALWPLLAEVGVRVDASVRPLHLMPGGPDHFDAPSDPYWVRAASNADILEVPLTCTPLFQALPHVLRRGEHCLPPGGRAVLRRSVRQWGALALLPVYHPLWAMRLITSLHVARGGRVISLTWHSSEMMPGGAPHIPDQAAVDKLLRRVEVYLDWLTAQWPVHGMTLEELRRQTPPETWPRPVAGAGDWH